MKKTILTSIALTVCLGFANASVKTDIESANKTGKTVFLVVTETGNSNNANAITLGKDAQKKYPKSTVIEMNRLDKANADLVAKYRLAGAPTPLILVIANNGVVSGGAAYNQTTADGLVAMIPSPKKAEVLKNISEGKSVFLVVTKKTMKKKDALSKCEIACAELKESAKTVEIDFDSADEKKFLKELNITSVGATPSTYVINAQGQIAGSFTGTTDSKTLVATATKKPASGCCAPGSGKSCGPK